MKPVIYLHIGAHKTGTTALQNFLDLNYKLLRENGILYPSCFRKREEFLNSDSAWATFAHHHLAWHFMQARNLFSSDFNYAKELEHEIGASSIHSVILSSEVFEEEQKDWQRKLELLKNQFSEYNIKVIFYLRRQDKFIASSYKTVLDIARFSGTIDQLVKQFFNGSDNPLKVNLNYYQKVNELSAIFRKDKLIIKIYEAERIIDGLFQDFLLIFNVIIDKQYKYPSKQTSNIGFNENILDIYRLCNPYIDDNQHALLNQILNSASARFKFGRKPFEEYNFFTQQQRQSVLNHFNESNEKLAKEYLADSSGKLFFEDSNEDNAEYNTFTGITLDKFMPIIMGIVTLQQGKILELESTITTLKDYGICKTVFNRIFELDQYSLKSINTRNDIETVEWKNGNLAVMSIGKDPYLIIRIPAKSWNCYRIFFSVQTVIPIECQFFYRQPGEIYFSEKSSMKFELSPQKPSCQFDISGIELDSNFRVDLGTEPTQILINSFTVDAKVI